MRRRANSGWTRRAVLAALAAAPWTVRAATPARRKRLAVLFGGSREQASQRFAGTYTPWLAEHGWIEGRNLELLWFLEGPPEGLEALARQVVEALPDAILAGSTAVTRALQRATGTIPIVTSVGDPVGAGFARSLARPGGNITGLSFGLSEGLAKMAEIARLALPNLRAVSVIQGANPRRPLVFETTVQEAFRAQGIEAKIFVAASIEEVRAALRALPKAGQGAAILLGGAGLSAAGLYGAAIDLRVPTLGNGSRIVESGALLSYELYRVDAERREVAILDKVLRGVDPATIPFELPDRSRLSLNLRTARAIGVAFSPDFLVRADRVIE